MILFLEITNTTNDKQIVHQMSYYHVVRGTYKPGSSVEIVRMNAGNGDYAAYHEIVVHTSTHPVLIGEFIIISHQNSVDKDITLMTDGKETHMKTINGRIIFKPPFRADNSNSIRISLDPNERLQLQLISAD